MATVKGDARMAAVLRRALWSQVGSPTEDLVYVRGGSRYRVAASRIADIIADLRTGPRYDAGRHALPQRIAHLVLVQLESRGATPDDRDQRSVAASTQVKRYVNGLWPKLTADQVLFRLLSDPVFRHSAADGVLSAEEQAVLSWRKPPRSVRSVRWSVHDAVLLDELADLIERTGSISHLTVDEAQDLSPMQCRALGRRCANGSLTILGDIAQSTSPWAVDDWATLLAHLDKPETRIAVLDRGFRVPAEILDYAARLLPRIAPGLAAPTSVRHSAGSLRITRTTAQHLPDEVVVACQERLDQPGSVGVIAADAAITTIHGQLCRAGLSAGLLGDDDAPEGARLVCVPASLAKGLEFDAVIVTEPAEIVDAEARGLHRLYVVLTRAVTSLHVIHSGPLPQPLDAEP
ncbi:HelD family protein [Micromonospora sp. LOL_023]|uniref:HelD family protein n=1 Tax=Micromonospora sp. LOL_023 TaxID=3345418 RepID=UPI003A83FCCF